MAPSALAVGVQPVCGGWFLEAVSGGGRVEPQVQPVCGEWFLEAVSGGRRVEPQVLLPASV